MDLYLDPVATTSRAVLALCEHDDLALRRHHVDLMKGEQHRPPLSDLNPNHLVPVLVDGDFVLTEASAILRYLARTTGSRLYPADARAQARVDERMAWFESNLYRDIGHGFVYPQLMPHHRRPSAAVNAATVEWGRAHTRRWLDVLDAQLRAQDGDWLCGAAPTIADFFGASILSLGALTGCRLAPWPQVDRWLRAVQAMPAWRRANAAFDGFAASLAGKPFVTLEPVADAQAA